MVGARIAKGFFEKGNVNLCREEPFRCKIGNGNGTERIKLARTIGRCEFWLDGIRRQMLAHASAIARTKGAMASVRDTPVSHAISRIDNFCRKCIRRMMFKSPMWITPLPPPTLLWGRVHTAQISMKIKHLPGSAPG